MRDTTKQILLIAVCVLGGLQLATILRGCNPPKTYFKELIAEKDSQIIKSERREAEFGKDAAEFKRQGVEFQKRDTIYLTKLLNNDKKLKAIDNYVRDASKDELRSYRPDE